jgi:hypothetical protein
VVAEPGASPEPHESRRRFIRHTVDVPLEVSAVANTPRWASARNVSYGGISFLVADPIPIGTIVEVRIPDVRPPFEARAKVVWSAREGEGHCLGVAFLDADDAFRARMVEHVCAIERYRRELREREGRELTPQAAAEEWIRKYADAFPG